MNKEASKQLTQKQKAEVEVLANLPEEAIDTSDIPEIPDWSAAGRGLLYGPSRNRSLCDWTRTWCHGSGLSLRMAEDTRPRSTACYASTLARHRIKTPLREKVIEDLTRSDGLRLKPYRDSAGKLTIGVGRNLDDNGISEAEARLLLARDVDDAWRDLNDHCPWWGSDAGTGTGSSVESMLRFGVVKVVEAQEHARSAGEGRLSRRRG